MSGGETGGVLDDHPVVPATCGPAFVPSKAQEAKGRGGAGTVVKAANVRPIRVIVIGAGAAGMAAARHLRLLGHRVTVLEARQRIGPWPACCAPTVQRPRAMGGSTIGRSW